MDYAIFYQNYKYTVKRKPQGGKAVDVGQAATYDGAVHLICIDSGGLPVLLTALTPTT